MSQMPRTSSQLYKRLLSYAGRYRGFFIISLCGYILFSSMEAVMAMMMEYFIEGLQSRDASLMIMVPVLVVVARIVHGIGFFLGNFFIARVGLGVVNDLRKELFGSLVRLPNRYYDQHNSGEMVSLLIYNIQQVTGSVTNAVKVAMRDGFTVIALLGFMFVYNWKLTLLFLFIAPILAGMVRIASRIFRRLSSRMQTTMGGITHISNEALQGYRLVRSFNGQRFETERFNKASDENTRLATRYERVASLQGPVFHVVIAIDLAIMLFLVMWLWQDNVGSAVAYLTAAAMIAKPLRSLSTVNETIQKGLAAAETIFNTIDLPPEIDEGREQLKVQTGRIEFKDLCFQYDTNATPLRNINLVIEPGQTVALVGRSGSGKSTLTNLLLRFYEPDSGSITIDEQAITQVTLQSLRQQVALVNQQTVLFNDTVARNIAYGDLTENNEEVDRERVFNAAVNANASEFIEALPDGYSTQVGEDGARLSGGQRQRLAVARALFKGAPILVLDEATSALDTESEKAIQDALDRLQKGRTTLVIAHRLSTIENADKIVAMDNGQIVEMGTHQELLKKNGYYASLYTAQSSQQISAPEQD